MKFKILFLSIILLIPCFKLSAELFFNGYTGAKGDFYSDPSTADTKDGFDPLLEIQAYFAGQLNISKKLLVRSEFSIQSQDIFKSGLFNDTVAKFCINELSSTYVKPFLGNTQYISAFFGTFEPIGSDVFLQRQFGMKPITSLLTESWLGLRGSYIYPFYGAGASYILHLDSWPIAAGVYLYKNHAENEDDDDQINIDWRFATTTKYLTIDFAAGIGAPLSKKYNNDDVILLIDTLYLHTGLEVLVGNRYGQSLFLQAGFEQLAVRSKKEEENTIKDNEIYLLFEPRFATKNCNVHVSLFNFPSRLLESSEDWPNKKLIFIEDSLGLNLAIFTDNFFIKNRNASFGVHTTLSFEDKYLYDLKITSKEDVEALTDDFNVKVSPFLTLPVMSGTLHLMLQATITEMKSGWEHAVKCNIGYKAQL